jgi:hypothetical protein
MASLKKPASSDYRGVKKYFEQEHPVPRDESYIYNKEDIISLKPGGETAWLDSVLEKFLSKLSLYYHVYKVCFPLGPDIYCVKF